MTLYDPQAVYQKTDSNALDYWTTKPSMNLESELKKIEHLKKFGAAAYEAMRGAILAHHESEKKADSMEDLKRISDFVNYYGPLVNQSKEAQKELTIRQIMDGADLDEVKEALGSPTSWLTVESWVGKFTGIGKDKTFVEWLIPPSIGKLVAAKVKEGKKPTSDDDEVTSAA